MFGANEPKGYEYAHDIEVVGTPFATIQGEGPFAGRRAVFVRLAHCNLRCTFCDTEFTKGARRVTSHDLAVEVFDTARSAFGWRFDAEEPLLVVLTGGEPLRQSLINLVRSLVASMRVLVQIETAGTLPLQHLEDQHADVVYVVSPKTSRLHSSVRNALHDCVPRIHLKYIARGVVGGIWAPTQPAAAGGVPWLPAVYPGEEGYVHPSSIYVQPCEEYTADGIRDDFASAVAMQRAVDIAKERGWRLSLQLHKFAGLP